MRILITGAGGFLGAHLAEQLARAGHDVIAVARRWRSGNRAKQVEQIALDLAEGVSGLPSDIEAIVHAAAAVRLDGASTDRFVRDNVIATHNLVQFASRNSVPRFVFISSTSIYGRVATPILDESSPIVDPQPYGTSKLVCEQLLAEATSVGSRIALRLPAILGRGAHSNFPARMLQRIEAGESVTIFSPNGRYNAAVHVADLATFISELLRQGWAGFDAVPMGAAGDIPIREVVEIMFRALGRRVAVMEKAAESASFVISNHRASDVYGYRPMAIGEMIETFVHQASS